MIILKKTIHIIINDVYKNNTKWQSKNKKAFEAQHKKFKALTVKFIINAMDNIYLKYNFIFLIIST